MALGKGLLHDDLLPRGGVLSGGARAVLTFAEVWIRLHMQSKLVLGHFQLVIWGMIVLEVGDHDRRATIFLTDARILIHVRVSDS